MIMKDILKIAAALLIVTNTINAQTGKQLSVWKTAKKNNGIIIQYRWVNIGDTLKTREIRSLFTIKATHDEIINNLNDHSRLTKWNSGIKICKVYGKTEKEWITYTMYNIPRPLKQQDLVTRYSVTEADGKVTIDMKAVPEYVKHIKGVQRQENYKGKWRLYPTRYGKTLVEFSSVSFSKPMLPRFIQDPILQHMFVKSFAKLRELSEKHTGIPLAKQ